MVGSTCKSKLIEITQAVLMLVSLTGVVEASRAESALGTAGGYVASAGQHERAPDRRLADLARVERKRREDEHSRSLRGLDSVAISRLLSARERASF